MNRRPLVRALLASAAIASAIAVGACNPDTVAPGAKAMRPLSEKMLAEIERKDMAKDSPVLVRIFKEEAELEVWKEDKSGRFALLKTYPICRWSGELGPKLKEGDRQAPEGFYTITPGQMNPKSSYYLAVNMGYPNAYDRSWNRTGSELMIHGDCSSRGCYAMTDEQIGEIYALARDSFFGGQKAFQIQAFPFRMTPDNMARHRKNPHMAFWRMLKQGYDHFEVTRLEPKVDVCERKYVFDAQPPANSSTPLKFQAAGKCPVYEVDEDIVAAVAEKQERDEQRLAELSNANVPTAPIRTGRDGGMNPVFLAALKSNQEASSDMPVRAFSLASAPGTVPEHTVPPGAAAEAAEQAAALSAASRPVPTPQPSPRATATRVASAGPVQTTGSTGFLSGLFSGSSSGSSSPQSGGILDRMSRLIGLGGSAPATTQPAKTSPAPKARAVASRSAQPTQPPVSRPRPETAPSAEPVLRPPTPIQTAASPVPVRPTAPPKPQPLSDDPPARAVSSPGQSTLAGAAPVLPSATFDGRWGAFR